MHKIYKTYKPKESALLIGVQLEGTTNFDISESLQELELLTNTAEVKVVGIEKQQKDTPNPTYYIGSGKAKELRKIVRKKHIDVIIFDNELSPAQNRNLSKLTKVKVIDRTQVILDIFAQHAKTRQSKIQVELAQLEYTLSRLKRMWTHLSRIEGGIGFRGPGEKQIEVDRRKIRDRIALLRKKLKEIDRITETKRHKRKELFSVSLVGYTNAGKTTILNKLAHSNIYTANKLFATLDTTTRALELNTGDNVVLSDTIGFIRKLPTHLISSFYATLKEVMEADLLLHIIDISHPKLYEYIDSVFYVLKGINADKKDMVMVFNKIDLLPKYQYLFLRKKLRIDFANSIFISAKNEINLEKIKDKIAVYVNEQKKEIRLCIPQKNQSLVSFLHSNTEILDKEYYQTNVYLHLRIHKKLLHKIEHILEPYFTE